MKKTFGQPDCMEILGKRPKFPVFHPAGRPGGKKFGKIEKFSISDLPALPFLLNHPPRGKVRSVRKGPAVTR